MPSCVYKLAQGSVIKPRPQKSPSAQKEDCTSAKKNQIVFVYTPRTPIRQITRVLRFERLRFFNKLHVFNGREYSDSPRLHHSDWGSGVSCDLTGRVFRTESLLHFLLFRGFWVSKLEFWTLNRSILDGNPRCPPTCRRSLAVALNTGWLKATTGLQCMSEAAPQNGLACLLLKPSRTPVASLALVLQNC